MRAAYRRRCGFVVAVFDMRTVEVTIHLCSREEMKKLAEKYFPTLWYRRWIRGFAIGNEVYIVEDAIAREALIGHEMAHVLWGEPHHRFPDIMFFSGLGRIFAFHPRDVAKAFKLAWSKLRTRK